MTKPRYPRLRDPVELQIETLSCPEHLRAQALARYRFSAWVVETVWAWLSSMGASSPLRT